MKRAFATREEIRATQLEQLRGLLRSILPANRFYEQKSRGVDLQFNSLADFVSRFPFTTKSEIVADQQTNPPFGTNLTFAVEKYTRFHQTSGTTGTPLRWLDTPESWQWMVESWKEVFKAAELGSGDRVFFAFSFGPFIGFWLAFEAAQQLGALCIPAGGMSSEARLRGILENSATVLCCTPTYAIHLAEVATKSGIDLQRAKLKTLLVAGEPGGSVPAVRQRLRELWPTARVFDHHGMTEVGPVTYECPKNPSVLHVIESAYFAEVIEPVTGTISNAGETGELVLTTIGRTGSPLIRYRTGDLVKAAFEQCSCGRSEMRLIGGILGRADDMVIVRGVNVYPSAVEDVLRRFSEIAEYRVHLTQRSAMPELSIEVEPAGDSKELTAHTIEKALQTSFNLRIPVTIVTSGSLPRFEMKAKRWVRH